MLPGVTLTGLDPHTAVDDVIALGERYPNAEFGLLVSKSRAGVEGRYPALDYVKTTARLLDISGIKVAIHFCGSAVHQFIAGDRETVGLAEHASRVQLNFNVGRTPVDPAELEAAIAHFGRPVITQHNPANAAFSALIQSEFHRVLFDASGGEGVRVESWPHPLPGKLCGYAGGIGPDTVHDDVRKAEEASTGLPYWIDMESSLRTDDRFDLDRCRVVLERVEAALSSTPGPA